MDGSQPSKEELDRLVAATRARREARALYPRVLRLRVIRPTAWQRAVFVEGALAVALVLVLGDKASAWTFLVLPLWVAVVVKGHDLLARLLGPSGEATSALAPAAPGGGRPHPQPAARDGQPAGSRGTS